jgi:hypothetical protein
MADDHSDFATAWGTICSEIIEYTKNKILGSNELIKNEDLKLKLTKRKWVNSVTDHMIFMYPLMSFELTQDVDGVLVSKKVDVELKKNERSFNVEATILTKTSILGQPFAKKEKNSRDIQNDKDVPEKYNKIIEFYPKIDDLSQYICELLKLSDRGDDKSIIKVNKRASETNEFLVESEEGINSLQIDKGWDNPENNEETFRDWAPGDIPCFKRFRCDFARQLQDYCVFDIENSLGMYWFFSKDKALNVAVLLHEGGVAIFRFYLFYRENKPHMICLKIIEWFPHFQFTTAVKEKKNLDSSKQYRN